MRRILTALILLAIVGGTAWWLWQWQEGPEKAADPWAGVAADAVAVLEVSEPFKAWDRFTGTSQFWGDLEDRPAYAALDTIVARLGRVLPATKGKEGLAGPLLVVWRINEANEPVPVVLMPWPRSEAASAFLGEALGTAIPADLWTGGSFTARPDSALPPLAVMWHNGILLAGAESGPVGQARSLLSGAPRPDPLFAKAKASLSLGADAHLLVKPWFAARMLALPHNGAFPLNAEVKGWMAMDLRFRPGAVLMNGLTFTEEEDAATRVIRGQQAAKLDMPRVLPATVTDLSVVQVENPAAFVKDVTGQEPDEALFEGYAAWVHGTVGTAREVGEGGGRWAVLGTGDPEAAQTALQRRCPDGGCPVTEYRAVRITRVPDPQALATLFGNDFAGMEQPLWALLGQMVVFADTPAAMRAAIDAWVDRNALALGPRTGDFLDRYASDAVYTWWADVPRSFPAGQGPLAEARRTIGSVLLQLAPREDGAIITTFCVQHATQGKQAQGALWTAALPAPLSAPPILVKDYLSKTLQVFAQDRDDRISLISCTGKILWQRQLDGPVMGVVQQIDRYRNGKLQLLLNTKGKVYLIDRLGRDVEGFPVELKGEASAPLSVFDYEGNKDYRIIVPMANGRLANLGPDGRPVQGWEPATLASPVVAPVEHVRVKGKDYLLMVQRNGQVAVLDRRGAVRYTPKLRMAGMQAYLGSRDAMDIGDRRLLWSDSTGAVLSGKLDGPIDTVAAATSGVAALFNPDGNRKDAVLRTTASMATAEYNGQVLFRTTFPDSPRAEAFAVPMGNGTEDVGIVQPEQEQLRLFNAEGRLWPGFPMKGAVRFQVADINLDGVLELVTADAQGVVTVHALPAQPWNK
ncbi:MAG TPA: hypothetical protein PKD45_13335 [Flavobacteriales bacterium]|nr:hypothetical protein [Flavobacteriales bacterium]